MHAVTTLATPTRPPLRWLTASFAYALVAIALALAGALSTPWMGLRLQAGDGAVVVARSQAGAAAIPVGAELQWVGPAEDPRRGLRLEPQDLMEEPDMLPGYADMARFFERQQQLSGYLQSPQLALGWKDADGREHSTAVQPQQRPLTDLPLLFWFQLAVSCIGCQIACGVWALRPGDWGARMFGITGLSFPVFAMPAAWYGTRELALPGGLFQSLSHLNHWGAMLFGAALVGLFLIHPRPLVRPRHLLWPFGLFSLWWLADVLRLVPSPDLGMRMVAMTEMALAAVLAIVQWRRTRGHPLERASLRWLSLSMLVGSGLFILLIITTATLGWLPPMPQGYAFGFFLFIYIGIALGLRRHRLFELDEWAVRLLLWVGGALAVLGLDALLILALKWSPGAALGISLWVCGLLYFPARQWLWRRFVRSSAQQVQALMPDVVRIAFEPARAAREALWDDLLRRLYDPLVLAAVDGPPAPAGIDDAGLVLQVPACGAVAARQLRYPGAGQRLFSTKDATLMAALCQLMDQAEAGRTAHARGAQEERRRIARDVHDDVGARLLMLIHRAESTEQAELARAAMNDLRTALDVLDAHETPLADALADWRAEATARGEAAGVPVDWTADLDDAASAHVLPSRHKAVLERALREGLSNALRHARARRVEIAIGTPQPGRLDVCVRNDGVAVEPAAWVEGRGLRGMRHRLAEFGGTLQVRALADGRAELAFGFPLRPLATAGTPPALQEATP